MRYQNEPGAAIETDLSPRRFFRTTRKARKLVPSLLSPEGTPGISGAWFLLVTDRIVCVARNCCRGGYAYTRVFPVNIDTVKVVLLHEVRDVGSKRLAVSCAGSLAENLICRLLRREVPTAKADNSLRARDILEVMELIVG